MSVFRKGRFRFTFSSSLLPFIATRRYARVCFLLPFLLFLNACGGSSSTPGVDGSATPPAGQQPPATARPISLNGAAVASNIAHGSVSVYLIVDGVKAALPAVTGSTDANGQYTVNIPNCADPCAYLVEVTGGTYIDEATGQSKTIDLSTPIRAIGTLDANATSATISPTPLTELATRIAESDGDLDTSDITAANTQVGQLFLGVDSSNAEQTLLTTVPAVATNADATNATETERMYGLMLAAVSQLDDLPDALTALATDIADGNLDQQAAPLKTSLQTFLASDMNNTGLLSAEVLENTLTAAAVGTSESVADSSEHDITAIYPTPVPLTVNISQANKTVTVVMPEGTDVTALNPTLVLSFGATVSPSTAQDFTNPVTYTVTAQNGATQDWTVSITAHVAGTASPQKAILGMTHNVLTGVIINATQHVVTGEVASGGLATLDTVEDLTTLFELSAGASIAANSGSYASGQVTYTVTAADESTQQWTVRLTEQGLHAQPTFSIADGTYHELQANAADFTLTTEGGHSAITTEFSSSDANVATISTSGVVTLHGAGTVILTARKPAATVDGVVFQAALAQAALAVTKADQAALQYINVAQNLSTGTHQTEAAQSGSGTGALSFTSSDSSIVSVNSSGLLAFQKAGTVTITVTKAADAKYLQASTTFTVTVSAEKAAQTGFSAGDDVSKTFGDGTFTQAATGGSGDGAVTYQSDAEAVATVNATSGEVTIKGAGTATITATKAGDDSFLEAQDSYQLTVAKANQSGFSAGNNRQAVFAEGASYTQAATGGQSTGAVSYESNNTDVATVAAGGVVTLKGAGSATITATKAGDSNFNPISSSYTLTVELGDQLKPEFSAHPNLVLFEGQSIHLSSDAAGTTPPSLQTLVDDGEGSASEAIQLRIANFVSIPAGFGVTIGMDSDSGTYKSDRSDETIHVHPAADFHGTTTITLQARDEAGNESEPITFTLTIHADEEDTDGDGVSNRAEIDAGSDPLNGEDVFVADSGAPTGCCLFAQCFDIEPTTAQLPAGGSNYGLVGGVVDGANSIVDTGKGFLTLNTGNGAYSFTPTHDACDAVPEGQLCTATFQYTVDGGDAQTVLIVIDRPLNVTATSQISVALGATSSDSAPITDPDGEPLTYRVVTEPELGSVSVDAETGGYSYTAPIVADGVGDSIADTTFVIGATPLGGSELTTTFSVVLTAGADTDADSMPDAVEDFYGFDKNDPADADEDADGDGITNAAEVGLVMNPLQAGDDVGGNTEEDRTRHHVMNRLAYGFSAPLEQQIIDAGGTEAWIAQQLANPQTMLDPDDPTQAKRDNYYLETTEAVEVMPTLRAMESERQLQVVMGHFWDDHFSTNFDDHKWNWMEFWEEDQYYLNAFGNFRDLLNIVATSPVMSKYLNGETNVKGKPNENFAREIMELHSLGINGGYTAEDIAQLARIFTGWNYTDGSQPSGFKVYAADGGEQLQLTVKEFIFNAEDHDDGTEDLDEDGQLDGDKPFLIDNGGKVITSRSGADGVNEGHEAMDILASHPKTANFICTKLARKFVNDSPSTATLTACETTFLNNTQADDQIAKVLQTLFSTDEFNTSQRSKIKDTQEYFLSLGRVLEQSGNRFSGSSFLTRLHNIGWRITEAGQGFFRKPEPTGWAEGATAWNNTSIAIKRLTQANDYLHKEVGLDLTTKVAPKLVQFFSQDKGFNTPRDILIFLLPAMTGGHYTSEDIQTAYDILRPEGAAFVMDEDRFRELVGWLAAQSEFHVQ